MHVLLIAEGMHGKEIIMKASLYTFLLIYYGFGNYPHEDWPIMMCITKSLDMTRIA